MPRCPWFSTMIKVTHFMSRYSNKMWCTVIFVLFCLCFFFFLCLFLLISNRVNMPQAVRGYEFELTYYNMYFNKHIGLRCGYTILLVCKNPSYIIQIDGSLQINIIRSRIKNNNQSINKLSLFCIFHIFTFKGYILTLLEKNLLFFPP